eukprot:CAMPEP_0171328896 /NCGR_PEP_ID=MMETSP0878-20121228/912_1 /TAXON_ID=67004 /ORGANISM="Thalassiosira weissflogii, Strain CCMP1336" /LENGTH=243 /DNA_ID=CAMNT_0011828783 /DNA_START=8 /DNA_END=739 /DNA_ORIENTATION=+
MKSLSILTTLLLAAIQSHAFVSNNAPTFQHAIASKSRLSMSQSTSSSDIKKKTTLTDETKWRLRLLLNDVTTTKGKKLNGQLFVLEGNFIEEEGYEPPQGTFKELNRSDATSNDSKEAGDAMTLKVSRSRWTLSEDPNDKKDGLWIWGLFKEPLYPFMLLQLETKELKIGSINKNNDDDGETQDSIPPLKLYAQITHIRNEEVGVELKPSNLNVRVLERVQLPGASVDLYEEEAIGSISFQPF